MVWSNIAPKLLQRSRPKACQFPLNNWLNHHRRTRKIYDCQLWLSDFRILKNKLTNLFWYRVECSRSLTSTPYKECQVSTSACQPATAPDALRGIDSPHTTLPVRNIVQVGKGQSQLCLIGSNLLVRAEISGPPGRSNNIVDRFTVAKFTEDWTVQEVFYLGLSKFGEL